MEIEFEALHVTVLVFTALVIMYSDHQAFLYLRGKKETLSANFTKWSHRLVWVGLLLMICTGAAMVVPDWEYYLSNPVFLIKMSFVLVLLINAFFIGRLSRVATETPFVFVPSEKRTMILISGFLSGIGWIGAAVIGFFFL